MLRKIRFSWIFLFLILLVAFLLLIILPKKISSARAEEGRYQLVDMKPCANSDYHHNPFIPKIAGSDHFHGLSGGFYYWRKGLFSWQTVPFQITDSYNKTKAASTITTGEDPYFSCSISLVKEPTKAIYVAMDSAWIKKAQRSRIANFYVYYQDGTYKKKIIITNIDVWSFNVKPEEGKIPDKVVLWESKTGRKLVVVPIKLDPRKIPVSIEINTMPAFGLRNKQPAIAVFAMTQELMRAKK